MQPDLKPTTIYGHLLLLVLPAQCHWVTHYRAGLLQCWVEDTSPGTEFITFPHFPALKPVDTHVGLDT